MTTTAVAVAMAALRVAQRSVAGPGGPPPLSRGTPSRPGRRLQLWELRGGWHCSIVGTCLSLADIRAIARRSGLSVSPEMRDYELHSWAVNESAQRGEIAEQMQKLLDERYSGLIRRVGRTHGAEALRQLWDELCAHGLVAGGYWAMVTHRHVPDELATHVFGDVHMLSHFLAGHNKSQIERAQRLQVERDDLAQRLQRLRIRHRESLAERDARIAELERELAAARAAIVSRVAVLSRQRQRDIERLQRQLARAEHRLTIARARARLLEETDAGNERPGPPAPQPLPPFLLARPAAPPDLGGRHILYVGGRQALLPHLRAEVERHNGRLLHHDGGIDSGARRLTDLVSRADLVLCPIDCVSHRACCRLKDLCRKHCKAVMFLRSSGRTALRQGLAAAAQDPGDPPGEPTRGVLAV